MMLRLGQTAGGPILINTDSVSLIKPHGDKNRSVIILMCGSMVETNGTPEQLAKLMGLELE